MRAIRPVLAISLFAWAAPAVAQQEVRGRGTIPHQAASTGFPEQVGEFRRGRVIQYDASGQDVSAGYHSTAPGSRETLTVYIYPPRNRGGETSGAAACRREFDANLQEIRSAPVYSDIRQGPTGAAAAMPDSSAGLSHSTSFTYRFRYGGQDEVVRSAYRLYCDVRGRWLVKYRITAPQGIAVDEPLEQFIRSGPWPGRSFPANSVGVEPSGRRGRTAR